MRERLDWLYKGKLIRKFIKKKKPTKVGSVNYPLISVTIPRIKEK